MDVDKLVAQSISGAKLRYDRSQEALLEQQLAAAQQQILTLMSEVNLLRGKADGFATLVEEKNERIKFLESLVLKKQK